LTCSMRQMIAKDRRGFAFTLAAFALVLVVASAYVILSETAMGCRSIMANETSSDSSILRSILIGGGSSASSSSSPSIASELYISEALQNVSSIMHLNLDFHDIAGNGTGEDIPPALGALNVLIKGADAGLGREVVINGVPEGSQAIVADDHLRLITSSSESSSLIRLGLNSSLDEGYVIIYTADSLTLKWSGILSPGDVLEVDYMSRTIARASTPPPPGFAEVMIRGLLPLSFLQLSSDLGGGPIRVAPYLADIVVVNMPDGVAELNATILTLSAVAYYRGPLSGGNTLYYL